ncbi:S8 family serine peptidase [Actinoplanes sp. CA-252034]|uniref:S8 family serine peptidase n=1 Tax=Actinoplanes sp. CA-252034 TaxID=3239906 RepID=UPI003D98E8C4
MSTEARRRLGPDRRWPTAVLSAALAVSAGTIAAPALAGPAQAATTTIKTSKKSWLVDPTVTTLPEVTTVIGAPAVWGKKDTAGRQLTGQGIGVALIDSGIAPVKGLAQPGKVINGPDLSFESQAPNLRNQDTFGHGTHMAGIIAGRDPEVAAGQEGKFTGYVGVAPGAHLVNLRVAAADGAVDVSQVIAAIDWAVAHRNDPGVNIRVLNLSFGTDSVQDPLLDPLSYAVEAAWRAGIVVVVSVGNDGPTATRVGNPAINPYVIAVGGSDIAGTSNTRDDDTIGTFSTRGNLLRHADLVAPGRSISSLRDPGSFVDATYPEGLVADGTGRYFKGSGTSQAAAVVSGAAALLLQQRPNLTPDQVKKLLTSTAVPMKGIDAIAQGAGQLNVQAAVAASTPALALQVFPRALGLGTLEGARGSAHVADPDSGVELTGERDIMNQPWKPLTWTAAAAAGRSWTGGSWNGTVWAGSAWTGTSWTSKTWNGTVWAARSWSGISWTARSWSAAGWTADGWSARSWSARSWSARSWSGSYWASRTWS